MIVQTPEDSDQHSEDMQEIISAPPSWLIRWGILLFFLLILMVVGASALIRYPDIVKTQLKVNSMNSPKPVVSKIPGRLISILVTENHVVDSGQILGYLESTANHEHMIHLLEELKLIQKDLTTELKASLIPLNAPQSIQLGEIQASYQNFYESYITYKASIANGLYLTRKGFLQKDLVDIYRQRQLLLAQSELQEKEHQLVLQEYKMHEKLFNEKVESRSELRREESKLLNSEHSLQQVSASLVNNNMSYSAKEKEIAELDAQIKDEKSKFIQALNTLISAAEEWGNKYLLTAHNHGKISFVGNLQKNQFINVNQEIFFINSGNSDFLGEMTIPQENMGKVKTGQKVLIKLKSYPFQEYGILEGRITYIADLPYNDSVFLSKVSFDNQLHKNENGISMKIGMLADAEIITEDASILTRLTRNISKLL